MDSKKKFMIMDGNSLVYRAFYALPLLTTKDGIYTNAVYGFTNMLMRVLNEQKPDYIAVAFDKGRVTFRTEAYELYKGHRKPTPDELKPQFALVKEVLQAMNISVYELEGFEADDIIGTLAKIGEHLTLRNLVVTGDQDTLQLVSSDTEVMLTRKGISETEIYTPEKVNERYGLVPEQIIDLKALMGDASDNIPGVPGVGEKTALKLLIEYGSLESIYDHLENITGKLGEKLSVNKELAFLSKKLATIERNVPYEYNVQECIWQEPNYQTLVELFGKLDFKTLVNSMSKKVPIADVGQVKITEARKNKLEGSFLQLEFPKAIEKLKKDLQEEAIAIYYELNQPNLGASSLIGFGWSPSKATGYYVPGLATGQTALFEEGNDLKQLAIHVAQAKGVKKYCHDGKKLMVALAKSNIRIDSIEEDTMLSAYLINPIEKVSELSNLCASYLNYQIEDSDVTCSGAQKAAMVLELQEVLSAKIHEEGMDKLYYEIELPLTRVLADMELAGVKIDKVVLEQISAELTIKLSNLTAEIHLLAGEEFNINSPKQLGCILFEKLGLQATKKTKTGYSTDVEVLEHLAGEHEVVAKILEYRQIAKLKSTYIDGLKALMDPQTDKIHTTFNQAVVATGRLSSTEPNLQNIPIRMEEGRRIRKAFIPSNPDMILVSADYSQIELRLLADISGDANLIEAFHQGADIHSFTAAEVFGVPLSEVTREMRDRAKAVNFGIVYGISDFGLGRNLKIGRNEAKGYIEGYFRRYPGVKEYFDKVITEAKEAGFVTTMFNRKRYLPEITSKNFNLRSFGERMAMNTPIQGTAADIIKIAMVTVDKELRTRQFKAKMLLQVHDELIFEVPKNEIEKVVPLIRTSMEQAVELRVPLIVDMKKGKNWYDMVKIQ